MTTSESKKCESCGNSFGCGAKADGCWCVDVSVAPEVADNLKLKYADCLCPACLNALSTHECEIEWKIIDPASTGQKI